MLSHGWLVGVCLIILLGACREDEKPFQAENPYKGYKNEELSQMLAEKFEALLAFAQPEPCVDPVDWKLIPLSSACGNTYIAFHQNVDELKLKALVQDYNYAMEVYIPYIAPLIDCAPQPLNPAAIVCDDGKAVVMFIPNPSLISS